MITKEVKDKQLFVYYNGRLIYKRWLNLGYGIVFDRDGLPFSANRER